MNLERPLSYESSKGLRTPRLGLAAVDDSIAHRLTLWQDDFNFVSNDTFEIENLFFFSASIEMRGRKMCDSLRNK